MDELKKERNRQERSPHKPLLPVFINGFLGSRRARMGGQESRDILLICPSPAGKVEMQARSAMDACRCDHSGSIRRVLLVAWRSVGSFGRVRMHPGPLHCRCRNVPHRDPCLWAYQEHNRMHPNPLQAGPTDLILRRACGLVALRAERYSSGLDGY
jgi:hypothetical protein